MQSDATHKRPLYIRYAGPMLLETSLLNKGSAFSEREKSEFNLVGLLPKAVETIKEQVLRAYKQFSSFESDLDKHIYLRNIQDTNETLYIALVTSYLEETMPIIYTPTVGLACQLFSQIYRRKRGLFVTYPDRDKIDDMLQNATKQNVKVIVVTDSERILGLGDQGIWGMGIPIGKLALYSACGGISPAYTLPVTLDVGTNNRELLHDPMYMGWRHERVTGDEYFDFVDEFIQAAIHRWPNVLIQFEDFAQGNANPLLEKYRDKLCCFNDDIQGTAAVTVGTLLAACKAQNTRLRDQRLVFVGAGSAGCGIAQQVAAYMMKEGLTEEQALSQIFLSSSKGLLTDDLDTLRAFQMSFVKSRESVSDWFNDKGRIDLIDIVKHAKPTVLIGVSGQAGIISKAIVKEMFSHCERPIIFPLSNPTSKVEAFPEDLINWTEGQAIVATGSPFEPVKYKDGVHTISQCNNSYIFPGIGLAVISVGARRVTDNMFQVASEALAECSPLAIDEEHDREKDLLPKLSEIRSVSQKIALAVAIQAMEDNVATRIPLDALKASLAKNFWSPVYREYRRTSF